jgi:hypothetical protein
MPRQTVDEISGWSRAIKEGRTMSDPAGAFILVYMSDLLLGLT